MKRFFFITATLLLATAACNGGNAPPINIKAATVTLSAPSSGCPSSGVVGVAYSCQLASTGGIAPYTYKEVSGAIPPGLVLDSSTGFISGVPTSVVDATPGFESCDSEPTPVCSAALVVDPVMTLGMLPFSPSAPINIVTGTTITAFPAAVREGSTVVATGSGFTSDTQICFSPDASCVDPYDQGSCAGPAPAIAIKFVSSTEMDVTVPETITVGGSYDVLTTGC